MIFDNYENLAIPIWYHFKWLYHSDQLFVHLKHHLKRLYHRDQLFVLWTLGQLFSFSPNRVDDIRDIFLTVGIDYIFSRDKVFANKQSSLCFQHSNAGLHDVSHHLFIFQINFPHQVDSISGYQSVMGRHLDLDKATECINVWYIMTECNIFDTMDIIWLTH